MPAAKTDVERYKEVAFLVPRRAEGELVIVSRHAPAVANRLVLIDHIVSVMVDELRQLRALNDVGLFAIDEKPERLVQAGGMALVSDFAQVFASRIVDEPDVTAACAAKE